MDAKKVREAADRYNARAVADGWESRSDPDLAFGRQALTDMLLLWDEKAAGGVPKRSSFDARSLKTVLPYVVIVEKVVQGDRKRWRYRYFGTEMVRLLGEYTGRFLDEVLPPEHENRWSFCYDCALDTPAPMRLTVGYQLARLEYYDGEVLQMPLLDDSGAATLVMGVTFVRPKM